jgi:segregation and condensation protein B
LLTRAALAPWLARLGHLPPPVRLSTPMMETLAVVAYRQPVSRANAEAVRGVACGELLRQLMERDLIRIVGRGDELGRPYLYGTTKRFLQLFGLPNADALPPIQWHALHEDPEPEDSPPDDLSTSTKEPVVSTAVAPVLSEVDPEVLAVTGDAAPRSDASVELQQAPSAIDDDEEDEFYDDDDEDDDEDWDDEDDEDWDDEVDDDEIDDDEIDDDEIDDDEIDDELDDDEEEDELDDEDDGWEEVDDEDDDEDEEDDEDEDWDEEEDDDEDWDEDELDDAEEEEEDEDWE